MRILLVEDDTMIGESVLDCLRAEHYAADWVKDGNAADLALRTGPYDLILLDLGLPRRDGLTLLRELRARKDRTPVLIATARDAVSDRIADWTRARTTTSSNPMTWTSCWPACAR